MARGAAPLRFICFSNRHLDLVPDLGYDGTTWRVPPFGECVKCASVISSGCHKSAAKRRPQPVGLVQ
eukprot:scaffold34036_cov28-Tisochrysis_lutea.AAC.2